MTNLEALMTATPLTIDYDEAIDSFLIHDATQMHQRGLLNVPGCRFAGKGKKHWVIPARYAQAVALGNMFQLKWTYPAIDRFTKISQIVTAGQSLRADGLDPESEEFMVSKLAEFGVVPKPGQAAAMVQLATVERCALFSDTGAGKSLVIAGTMKLYGIGPVLIICPNGVLYNWQRELDRFGIDSVVLDGTAAQRRKIEESFDPRKTPVMICSYGIARKTSRIAGYGNTKLKRCNECGGYQDIPDTKCEVHERFLNTVDWDAIVIDEAHRICDPHSVQTRAVWQLSSEARYCWPLTATPIESRPDQFWSILHTIDPVEHPSSTKYRDRYLLQVAQPWGGTEILGLHPHNAPEFHEVTQWRWRRDAVVGLPETVYEIRTCTLSPKNAKAYKQMAEQMMAELGDNGEVLSADNPMVKYGRLRQFANATCVLDTDGEVQMTNPSEKLDLFEDTLEDVAEPAIAWFASRKLLDLAAARLTEKGVKFEQIHGGVSAADRQRAVDSFQGGHVDLMLLNPAAGGEGITLTRARVSIWVMEPDSSIQHKQASGRIKRYGVEHDELLDITLITLGTVEEELITRREDKATKFKEVVPS